MLQHAKILPYYIGVMVTNVYVESVLGTISRLERDNVFF